MKNMKLRNGVQIPQVGFGVYQVTDPAQCEQAVLDAIEAGYRHIDTAAAYMNEEAVGAAIKKCGVSREELFITTKLWVQDANYESAKKAFQISMDKLGVDYVDLYLIHQPFGDIYGAWRAMEELHEAGKIRAIGVSNFGPDRLVDLCMNAKIAPMVNQVEVHPFCQQVKAMETMKEFGVQITAWSPMAQGMRDIFQNEELANIGAKYGKSVAQVILRWHIQRDVVIIPKSVHKERIEANLNIFDFSLSDEEMAIIAAMDTGASIMIDFHTAETAKMFNSAKIHE